jgi:hypothetical protein
LSGTYPIVYVLRTSRAMCSRTSPTCQRHAAGTQPPVRRRGCNGSTTRLSHPEPPTAAGSMASPPPRQPRAGKAASVDGGPASRPGRSTFFSWVVPV